jgi:hypothetical protein
MSDDDVRIMPTAGPVEPVDVLFVAADGALAGGGPVQLDVAWLAAIGQGVRRFRIRYWPAESDDPASLIFQYDGP